jgi:hypothetical protein
MNKDRITITVDADLLRRIDAVAGKRNEARSAMIERLLAQAIKEEEQFIADMENPVMRALARIIAETPGVAKFVGKLGGADMTPENIDRVKQGLREAMKQGKERTSRAKAKGVAS